MKDATGGFGVSKPAISKHLKVLEESGVVSRVIDGRTHRLSLDTRALGEAADWMDPSAPAGSACSTSSTNTSRRTRHDRTASRIARGVGGRPAAAAVKEKEYTRARDALAAERRRMPMIAVGKEYAFEGPDGPVEAARPLRRAAAN